MIHMCTISVQSFQVSSLKAWQIQFAFILQLKVWIQQKITHIFLQFDLCAIWSCEPYSTGNPAYLSVQDAWRWHCVYCHGEWTWIWIWIKSFCHFSGSSGGKQCSNKLSLQVPYNKLLNRCKPDVKGIEALEGGQCGQFYLKFPRDPSTAVHIC